MGYLWWILTFTHNIRLASYFLLFWILQVIGFMWQGNYIAVCGFQLAMTLIPIVWVHITSLKRHCSTEILCCNGIILFILCSVIVVLVRNYFLFYCSWSTTFPIKSSLRQGITSCWEFIWSNKFILGMFLRLSPCVHFETIGERCTIHFGLWSISCGRCGGN